jgi:hypothetical protein
LPKRVGHVGAAEVYRSALRCTLASGIMGAVVYDVSRLGRWMEPASVMRNVAVYGGTVAFGTLVYAAACSLLRSPELIELRAAIGKRRTS